MTRSEARELGHAWGIDVAELRPMSEGSVNSNFALTSATGQRYFLRVYEEQTADGAAREVALQRHLSSLSLPVAQALLREDGQALGSHRGKPVAIFSWLAGSPACQAMLTPQHLRALGSALGALHNATAGYPVLAEDRFSRGSLLARLDSLNIGSPGIDATLAQEVSRDAIRLREGLNSITLPTVPSGLVHGDLFRDNVLWQNDNLVALLDFESASHGALLWDLMVCLLAWCYGARFEPALIAALVAGYEQHRRLSDTEIEAAHLFATFAALRFATTRITDFELKPRALVAYKDYRRFMRRLAEIDQIGPRMWADLLRSPPISP